MRSQRHCEKEGRESENEKEKFSRVRVDFFGNALYCLSY
jgi:hypothetical protein